MQPLTDTAEDTTDEEFPEGRILTRLHRAKERNHRAVKQKKAQVLKQTGRLACEACGFDFEEFYGELGGEFAECHHTVPIAQLTEGQTTKLADLAIVCANCHRMLHRGGSVLTIEQLRAIIERNH